MSFLTLLRRLAKCSRAIWASTTIITPQQPPTSTTKRRWKKPTTVSSHSSSNFSSPLHVMQDDQDFDRIDQEIRINELREAAREAAGGEMLSWEDPEAPPEITEQFWANVLNYEQG